MSLWTDEGVTVCFIEASVTEDSGPPLFIPGTPVPCSGTLARLEGEGCLEAEGGSDGPPIAESTVTAIREWAEAHGY